MCLDKIDYMSTPAILCTEFWPTHLEKATAELEKLLKRATKITKRLKQLFCKEKLQCLGHLGLKQDKQTWLRYITLGMV